jgi:carboxyl-terminal processing protease
VRKVFFGFLMFPLVAGQIHYGEIKPVIDEILAIHVDEHYFNEKIARRSFKNYLDRFDPCYDYLLASEVKEFFLINHPFWAEAVSLYQVSNFSPYQFLQTKILTAIQRAQKFRKKIKEVLLSESDFAQPMGFPVFYAENEVELYERVKAKMQEELFSYAKEIGVSELSHDQKVKVIDFNEKKMREHEDFYLSSKNNSFLILKAISKSFDAHTEFYSEEESFELRKLLRKEFCGVGIHLKESVEGPFISDIVPCSPAEAVGLVKIGDFIKEIDGNKTDNISYQEILRKLVGKPHSTVSLVLEDAKGDKRAVKIKREKLFLQDERLKIDYEPFGDGIIATIELGSFYDNGSDVNAAEDLRQALLELQAVAPLNGLILDMRENRGGFFQRAVEVAGLFLQKGTVLFAKYAHDEVRFAKSNYINSVYSGPLVVLLSKVSASAAEIVAEVLQEEGAAIVVGDVRSYGKGSLQYQTITDPEAKYSYKVSVGRYFTSSGKSPQIEGVLSDIVVPTSYAPLQLGEKYLPYSLKAGNPECKKTLLKEIEAIFSPFGSRYNKMIWKKMVPALSKNSALRKENDQNLRLFCKNLENSDIAFENKRDGCGAEDLQKKEAINIVKDMILLSLDSNFQF